MKVRLVDSAAHPVRIAYAQHLFEAGTFQGEGEPTFSVTAIIPKDHPVIKELEAAEEVVAKAEYGKNWEATLKSIRAAGKGVVKDGDVKAGSAGFEGNAFVSMRSKKDKKPNVYNREGVAIGEGEGVYSGCYAHVICEVWAQKANSPYGKRINTQVTGVRLTRDGDSFGGGASPAQPDDFADLSAADEGMLD